MKSMTTEQSLESIAIRLDELTGNAMGNSYLNVAVSDIPETDLRGVENQLDMGFSNMYSAVENVQLEIAELNGGIELLVMQLSRIADALEKQK